MFEFIPQAIPDVLLVEHRRHGDARGFFSETFRADLFAEHGVGPFVQDNHSRSQRGVLRGLHYQKRDHGLGKLIRCVRGRIFDVAVDIRRDSPSYGRFVTAELSEDASTLFWVPSGFAHGFCVLSDEAEILYKQTGYYAPAHERAIAWNDPALAIPWPVQNPLVSPRDRDAPTLERADNDF